MAIRLCVCQYRTRLIPQTFRPENMEKYYFFIKKKNTLILILLKHLLIHVRDFIFREENT